MNYEKAGSRIRFRTQAQGPEIIASHFSLGSLLGCITVFGARKRSSRPRTRQDGWSFRSNEYRVLRAKAYPVEHDPEPPPLDATLTRVEYDLRVLGDLAAGSAKLTVDVLKDGWVRVPVPAGLLVREARLDGKPLSLVPGDKGKAGAHLAALLSHAGRSVLRSTWMCRLLPRWRGNALLAFHGIGRDARVSATSAPGDRTESRRRIAL